MATITKQSPTTWRLRVWDGKRQRTKTVEVATRKEAKTLAFAWEQEVKEALKREARGHVGTVRMSQLLDEFERVVFPTLTLGTANAYRDSFKPLRLYFVNECNDPKVDEVWEPDFERYKAWRTAHGVRAVEENGQTRLEAIPGRVSGRTVNKELTVSHRLFRFARSLRYCTGNPLADVTRLKAPRRNPVLLNSDEYERLLEATAGNDTLRLYVLVLGECGLRCESEALWLRFEDIDFDKRFLYVVSGRDGHDTKTHQNRGVPMSARLVTAMREYFAKCRFAQYDGARSEWVFHHHMTKAHHRAGARIESLRRAFRSACRHAALKAGFTQHDLRHRLATLVAGKHGIAIAQKMLGHSDIKTTELYTHLVDDDLRVVYPEEMTLKAGAR